MKKFIAIGSAHWDILGCTEHEMAIYDDVPGRIRRMIGGVAGPVAMKLGKLGADIHLMGYAGHDELGDALMAKLAEFNINTGAMIRGNLPTDVYMGIEAPNGMIAAIADCHSLEAVSMDAVNALLQTDTSDQHVIVDGNLHEAALFALAKADNFRPAALTLIPASPGKINRLQPFKHPCKHRDGARVIVNIREANALCQGSYTDALSAAQALRDAGFAAALVSNGADCAAYVEGDHVITSLPPQITVKRFTGAGDTLAAHHLFAITRGDAPQAALKYALQATADFISREDLDA